MNHAETANPFEALIKQDQKLAKLIEMLSTLEDSGEEEMQVECIQLDGKEYGLMKELQIGQQTYYYFVNLANPMDFLFRKLQVDAGEEYFIALDSNKEFDMVMAQFSKLMLGEMKELARKEAAREKRKQEDLSRLKEIQQLLLYAQHIKNKICTKQEKLLLDKLQQLAEKLLAKCDQEDYRVQWGRYCIGSTFSSFIEKERREALLDKVLEAAPEEHQQLLRQEGRMEIPQLCIVFNL